MITSHLNGLKQTSKVDFKLKKKKYTLSTSLRPVRMFDPKFGFISYTFWRHSGNENSKKKIPSHGTKIRGLSNLTVYLFIFIFYSLKNLRPMYVCVHFLSGIINNTSGIRLHETFIDGALEISTKETNGTL